MEQPAAYNPAVTRGFSLLELVIVVVIIGIIGAIAVPRMSRGAEGAAFSALESDLTSINNALEFYAVEHNGDYPLPMNGVNTALTTKTNQSGGVYTGALGEVPYGPYLRAVPGLPVGFKKGKRNISMTNGPSAGWLYNLQQVRPNLNNASDVLDEALITKIINGSNLERADLVF